jgi:hypothetical protein
MSQTSGKAITSVARFCGVGAEDLKTNFDGVRKASQNHKLPLSPFATFNFRLADDPLGGHSTPQSARVCLTRCK